MRAITATIFLLTILLVPFANTIAAEDKAASGKEKAKYRCICKGFSKDGSHWARCACTEEEPHTHSGIACINWCQGKPQNCSDSWIHKITNYRDTKTCNQ